jgi:large subunit ribosomal protein L29
MKFKELTTKSETEVQGLLKDLREEANELAMKMKLNQVKNTAKLKTIKKDIARVLTYFKQKASQQVSK